MKGIIKSIQLIEDNEDCGFLVKIEGDNEVKEFGGLTDNSSFRRLFFGFLSILNNYDLADLTNMKGSILSCLIDKPDSIDSRIAAVGNKNRFLVKDKNRGYITQKLNFSERRLLKSIGVLEKGKIISIKSASGTICMTLEFSGYVQGVTGPNMFVGLGYPLVSRELKEGEEEFVSNYSASYIREFIKTVLNTRYLYKQGNNEDKYEVEYYLDNDGNIISIGNMVNIDGEDTPVFINKRGNNYTLDKTSQKREVKSLNRK